MFLRQGWNKGLYAHAHAQSVDVLCAQHRANKQSAKERDSLHFISYIYIIGAVHVYFNLKVISKLAHSRFVGPFDEISRINQYDTYEMIVNGHKSRSINKWKDSFGLLPF